MEEDLLFRGTFSVLPVDAQGSVAQSDLIEQMIPWNLQWKSQERFEVAAHASAGHGKHLHIAMNALALVPQLLDVTFAAIGPGGQYLRRSVDQ